MINPNKTYKIKEIGIIILIENRYGYIDMFTVKYPNGQECSGYVQDIKNFSRFQIGDRVKAGAVFSITQDKFLVKSLRKAA